MKTKFLICLAILFIQLSTLAQTAPALPAVDRIRIAEAFRIGEALRNEVWANWGNTQFSLLLITDEHEFLIRHSKPSDEFISIGYDKLLKSEIFVRPRQFQKNFLATFPAFGKPLIVVGQAENTSAKTSTPWVFTVLHEHFHQFQFASENYYAEVDALNLSGGDNTGMWQINYPFPYKNTEAGSQFKNMSRLLLAANESRNEKDRSRSVSEYIKARKQFAESLTESDRKYFSFQIWQEGIARYTEYKIAELAARKLKPGKEFRKLNDFTPFSRAAKDLLSKTADQLRNVDLARNERVTFYPFGAYEGFLLDKVNPSWRENYLTRKFALEEFYEKIGR